jgi:hypothetical protein
VGDYSGATAYLIEDLIMPKVFTVSFADNETMPDCIEAMAADLSITPEMLIRRALAAHLGEYGLQEVPSGVKVKSITEFLIHSGVLKPGTGEDEQCLRSGSS